MAAALMHDSVWLQKNDFEAAEAFYHAYQAGTVTAGQQPAQGSGSSLKNEIAQARQQIQNALNQPGNQGSSAGNGQLQNRIQQLEKENKDVKKTLQNVLEQLEKLNLRVGKLEGGKGDAPAATKPAPASAPAAASDNDDDDDDFDPFADDDDDQEEADERRKKLLAEYAAKKAKKPAVIAKSSVILDCKPWDDETDMKEMERLVRGIEQDGLVWGAAKLVDLAYGIKKLQIVCVVEDEKVSIEELTEEIQGFEDHVQSVDIAAFNKI